MVPAAFVPGVQIRDIARQGLHPHLAVRARDELRDLRAPVDGRAIPDHQQPRPRHAQQVQQELDAVQSVQRFLPRQGVDFARKRQPAHDRQVIARLLLVEDRCLGFGSIGPDHSRQQVEARFVLEHQHPALAPRPPEQVRPALVPPAPDGFFVPLACPPDRQLGRPVQFLEQPADMALMVADPELFLNDPSDAGTGPDIPPKAVRLGTMPEELGDQTFLRRRELGRVPRTGTSAQGLGPAIADTGEQTTDAHRGDAQRLGDVLPRPALLLQMPCSKPPPFEPVSRKEIWDFHTLFWAARGVTFFAQRSV